MFPPLRDTSQVEPRMTEKTLTVLPSLTGIRRPNGRIVLAGRFLSGMKAYRELWDGPLIAVVEPQSASMVDEDRKLGGDDVEIDPSNADFETVLLDYDDRSALTRELSRASIVLGGIHYRQNHIWSLGEKARVPVVYTSEYTLKTRLQVVHASVKNPLVKARRIAWEVNQERQIRVGLQRSAGLHANGTPTYEAYRDLSPSPLLFFDGRGSDAMLVPPDTLEERLARLDGPGPLRLVFAGRMNHMKGADELLKVARQLLDDRVPFTLDIYGGGILEDTMRETIAKEQMGHAVHMHGFVPFSELMPRIGVDYDLFLCCHVQGDPSGMYLEMLGKGLPFVGYGNEALAGILRITNVGVVAPVRDHVGCAKHIGRLASDPDRIRFMARAARAFAQRHTFDRSFKRRIEHLRSLASHLRQ